MTEIIVAQRMWQRRDTAANWTTKNPVLAAGEIGVELPGEKIKMKIGDGSTPWVDLAYFGGEEGGGEVEMRVFGGWIQYRASEDADWENLILVSDLAGSSSGQFLFGAGDRIRPLPLGPKALVPVTFAGTILNWRLVLTTTDGAPGSIVVDVRKSTFSAFTNGLPNAGGSITADAPPTIVDGYKAAENDLSGWNTSFGSDDVYTVAVLSRSINVTHFSLVLRTEKSS